MKTVGSHQRMAGFICGLGCNTVDFSSSFRFLLNENNIPLLFSVYPTRL